MAYTIGIDYGLGPDRAVVTLFKDGRPMDPKEQELMLSLREALAELEHSQWAHWTKYMLECLHPITIRTPETQEVVDRWRRQITTPYGELSEQEKDSDREWAYKVLDLVLPYVTYQVMLEKQATHKVYEDLVKSAPPPLIVDMGMKGAIETALEYIDQIGSALHMDEIVDIVEALEDTLRAGLEPPITREIRSTLGDDWPEEAVKAAAEEIEKEEAKRIFLKLSKDIDIKKLIFDGFENMEDFEKYGGVFVPIHHVHHHRIDRIGDSPPELREAVLDLFAQFEDPDRNEQDGDIQPQLDRLAELVGYTGPIRRT